MVAESDVSRIKKELADDNRDVADLWTDALRKYKGIVGEDLVPKFANVDAMIQFGSAEMNNFHQFRHSQKKVDKLRSLFMANLGYIEQGAQQLIAAATPAFPPAAAIGTALTYMLSVRGRPSPSAWLPLTFLIGMQTGVGGLRRGDGFLRGHECVPSADHHP